MEIVMQLLLLLLLLIPPSAGARLLDDDSTSQKKSHAMGSRASLTHSLDITAEMLHKESVAVDEEQGRAQNGRTTSPAGAVQMDTQNAYNEEIVSSGVEHMNAHSDPVPVPADGMLSSGDNPTLAVGHMGAQEVLSSGQSPGVGHMSIQINAHNEGMVFSGQNPNTGELITVQGVHIEGMLSSGQSPGVGHMSVHHSHVEGKLSSGQSPGVGHSNIQNADIEGKLSSGESPGVKHMMSMGVGGGRVHVIEEMLPSGDSPGVGHMSVQNGPKEEIQSSEGSPNVNGHMGAQDAHVAGGILSSRERQMDSEEKKMSTLNKLPAGSSPGVGHMVIKTGKKRKGPANPSPEVTETLNKVNPRPEADNSSPLGHVKESGRGVSGGSEEGEKGSMKELMGAGEGPEAEEERKKGGERIGCGGVGAGQPSGSINLFDESSYYGAPTSLVFGNAGKGRER